MLPYLLLAIAILAIFTYFGIDRGSNKSKKRFKKRPILTNDYVELKNPSIKEVPSKELLNTRSELDALALRTEAMINNPSQYRIEDYKDILKEYEASIVSEQQRLISNVEALKTPQVSMKLTLLKSSETGL